MGKRYTAEETKLIVELAKQGKSVKEVIEAVKKQFGFDRSELAVKGHIKAYGSAAPVAPKPTAKQPVTV